MENNTQIDHDLLVELRTKVQDISNDIRELKDGTARRIDNLEKDKLNIKESYPVLYKAAIEKTLTDHEERLRRNEVSITKIMTWGSALIVIIGIIEFIISKFIV